ncbi:MAG: hypothetical protein KA257_06665 [Opitutaceae bacterium]|nr:hypothetical protein [Opitutaceae bacterium]MBP9901144.1 hypothetical protein [Verrucomicrobiota bacterium]
MKSIVLTPRESSGLVALAIFGLLVPNGIFLYYFFTAPEVVRQTLSNPVALVFIAEAFFLMFLLAWLLRRAGSTKPTGWVFVVLSLVGSMAFSVPVALWLAFKGKAVPEN